MCRTIKLALQAWRRQSIFSMARAASFILMLEPQDRPAAPMFSTQMPLLSPESPQPLPPSLSCILCRCFRKTLLAFLTLDPPELDSTITLSRFILSASCRRHPSYTAASAVGIALADSPTPILPVWTSAWVSVAPGHSYPPAWTVCACVLQQMNLF